MKLPIAFPTHDPRAKFPRILPGITDAHSRGHAEGVMSGVGDVFGYNNFARDRTSPAVSWAILM